MKIEIETEGIEKKEKVKDGKKKKEEKKSGVNRI